MNTRFKAGLYQNEAGDVFEMEEHPDTGRGWLAHPVWDIARRTSTEGFDVRVIRDRAKKPVLVSIELWLTFKPFVVDMKPDVEKLQKVVETVRAVHAVTQPGGSDGAVSA